MFSYFQRHMEGSTGEDAGVDTGLIPLALDASVTAGIMLDWLPRVLLPSSSLTGTTLIALPAVLASFVLLSWKNQLDWRGLLFLVSLLLGLVPFLGTAEYRLYFGRYVIGSLFLLYYMRWRTPAQHRLILLTALLCALAVPACTYFGISGAIASDQIDKGLKASRMYVGVGASDLGLYLSIIPATLGGACFVTSGTRWRWPAAILGMCALGLAFYAAIAAQQRSAMAAFCIGIFLTALHAIRWSGAVRTLVGVLAVGAVLAAGFLSPLRLAEQLPERFVEMDAVSDSARIDGYNFLLKELDQAPSILGLGFESVADRYGIRPHNIFGELYAVGGLVLLTAGIIMFASVGSLWWAQRQTLYRQGIAWPADAVNEHRVLHGVHTALILCLAVHCLTHTSLGARITMMYLGLLIGALKHPAIWTSPSPDVQAMAGGAA